MCLRFTFCTHHRICVLNFLLKSQICCTLLYTKVWPFWQNESPRLEMDAKWNYKTHLFFSEPFVHIWHQSLQKVLAWARLCFRKNNMVIIKCKIFCGFWNCWKKAKVFTQKKVLTINLCTQLSISHHFFVHTFQWILIQLKIQLFKYLKQIFCNLWSQTCTKGINKTKKL
jgi:hypothetical protein